MSQPIDKADRTRAPMFQERRHGAAGVEILTLILTVATVAAAFALVIALHRRATSPGAESEPESEPVALVESPESSADLAPVDPAPEPEPSVEPEEHARAEAEPESVANSEPKPDPTAAIVDELEARRVELLKQAETEEALLEKLQAERERLDRHVALNRRRARALDAEAKRLANRREHFETDAELIALERDILLKRKAEAERDHQQAMRHPGYAVLPYRGPNRTWKRPIPVECVDGQAVIRPGGTSFSLIELAPIRGHSSPFARAVVKLGEVLERHGAPGGEPVEPYVLFVVRPDGIRPFYEARSALERLGVPFGYELVAQDREIEFPDWDDPTIWEEGSDLEERSRNPLADRDDSRRRRGDQERLDRGEVVGSSPPRSGPAARRIRPGGPKPASRSLPGRAAPPDGPSIDEITAAVLGAQERTNRLAAVRRQLEAGRGFGASERSDSNGRASRGAAGRGAGRSPDREDPSTAGAFGPPILPPAEEQGPSLGSGGEAEGSGGSADPGGTSAPEPPRGWENWDGPETLETLSGEASSERSEADMNEGFVPKPIDPLDGPLDESLDAGRGGESEAGRGREPPRDRRTEAHAGGSRFTNEAESPAARRPLALPSFEEAIRSADTRSGDSGGTKTEGRADDGSSSVLGSRQLDVLISCTYRGVVIHPGSYRIRLGTLKEDPAMLLKTLEAVLASTRHEDPSYGPSPSVRFLVEPRGREAFGIAKTEIALSHPDWPTTWTVTEPRTFSIFGPERW